MIASIEIRSETTKDIPVIAEVTAAAFQSLEVSNQTEHYIIEALRAARALSLSLVAEFQSRVIGHIAFSPLRISDGTPDWYGLGPVSVLPKYQRQVVGKALVQEGLSRLKDLQARGCCLVGHPEYYKKFGFDTLPGLVHEGVPPKVFLALSFDGKIPQGTALFHEGFKAEAPLSMLDKLTSLQPSDRSVELYDEWSPVYEEDLVGGYGYESPWIAAEYFADFLFSSSMPARTKTTSTRPVFSASGLPAYGGSKRQHASTTCGNWTGRAGSWLPAGRQLRSDWGMSRHLSQRSTLDTKR